MPMPTATTETPNEAMACMKNAAVVVGWTGVFMPGSIRRAGASTLEYAYLKPQVSGLVPSGAGRA
jgi:hypothetical protein